MENEVDPEVVKATQNLLGKYIKRPPLTEKLLKKPPFRFLHDIVTTVLKTTGFFDGLFEEDELVSENVKDRESDTTGKALSAKPSKIVAGQEPEKTNILLQSIADALNRNLSSKDSVQKYKESNKKPEALVKNKTVKSEVIKNDPVKKTTDTKKIKSNEKLAKKSSEKIVSISNKPTENKNKQKETKTKDNVSKKTVQSKLKDKNDVYDKLSKKSILTNETIKQNLDQDTLVQPTSDESKGNEGASLQPITDNNSEISFESNEREDKNDTFDRDDNHILNSSLSSSNLMQIESERNVTNLTQSEKFKVESQLINIQGIDENDESILLSGKTVNIKLKKGLSAESDSNKNIHLENKNEFVPIESNRKSIPFKGESENTFIRPASVRPSSSRPGAPRPREKFENIVISEPDSILVGKVNIITENSPNEEEEDSSIVIVDETILTSTHNQTENLHSSSNGHGHLVQQILDSQKDFSQSTGKTEIEWQFGAQKARDTLNQEVEQIRYNIQALSRAANPLGKLLDHLQEDVEIMRQELQQWTATYEKTAREVSKQKTINEESLLPLHIKLKQLDIDMQEKHNKINDIKVVIQKNSSRIDKLLESGYVQ